MQQPNNVFNGTYPHHLTGNESLDRNRSNNEYSEYYVPPGIQQQHQHQHQQQQQQQAQQHSLSQENVHRTGVPAVTYHAPPSAEERIQALMFERESRWAEVRRYSEFIRRFATEAAHLEVTKENYYDLYNMSVCLLKAVDGLDPDKIQTLHARKVDREISPPHITVAPPVLSHPVGLSENDIAQARRSFDYFYNRNNVVDNRFGLNNEPVVYPSSLLSATPVHYQIKTEKQTKNTQLVDTERNSNDQIRGEEEEEEEIEDDKKKSKRRRKRATYPKRNLQCHVCGVTETPEWRRGPAGEHTLCNACGLHYAKSLKKQKKESEEKKPDIENSLLSDSSQVQTNVSSSDSLQNLE